MIIELIEKYNMLPSGCRVLCALSGGADSVYLLCRLRELSAERGFSVCAAHFNHCLRGEESDRDERFAGELCEKLGVPFISERGDVAGFAEKNSLGVEEAARTLRYDFLERAALRLSCSRIATAHTADDNGETVLMNLARGSGLRGLGGIPPVRGDIIRPLLTTTRAEIEKYLAENHIGHVEDHTNALDDYARNRVRHIAVPALRSVNAAFSKNASRAALLIREDEEFLMGLALEFIKKNSDGNGVSAPALAALPFPVASRVIRTLAGGTLPEGQVRAALSLCNGSGLARLDVDGGRFTREQGRLSCGAEEKSPITPAELSPGERIYLPEAGAFVSCEPVDAMPEIYTSLNTFFFNCENICGTIICTSRRPGDKIRIMGRGCTKRLSDLFTEKHMTQRERDAVIVLRDDVGPIAVSGFGTSERCAAKKGEAALRIDIEVGEKL